MLSVLDKGPRDQSQKGNAFFRKKVKILKKELNASAIALQALAFIFECNYIVVIHRGLLWK
ncbi:hypothetical protein B7992_11610 [Fibrobacter sp. UWH1]|nr:hypothetical protein B7992_11610 [Fibrobacter sp. UWH1]